MIIISLWQESSYFVIKTETSIYQVFIKTVQLYKPRPFDRLGFRIIVRINWAIWISITLKEKQNKKHIWSCSERLLSFSDTCEQLLSLHAKLGTIKIEWERVKHGKVRSLKCRSQETTFCFKFSLWVDGAIKSTIS